MPKWHMPKPNGNMRSLEIKVMRVTLNEAGSITKAAKMIGWSRNKLIRRMDRYKFKRKREKKI